jgi:hypothetical protein
MAFTLVQAGSTLELYDASGNHGTVTLPTNIALSTTRQPRFAIFDRYVVVVNSPNRPITVDGQGIARVLCPRPPSDVPTLSAQAGGGLTGTYTVKQTFLIKDDVGNIIAESDFGPVSAAQAVAAQYLRASGLSLSPDSVSATRLYRTATLGSVYFPWVDLDGNTQTAVQDDLADAGLALVAAPVLGTPPDLTLIAEWRGRLWGVDRLEVDDLRYTESGRMWAWKATNLIPIPKTGSDSRGITAFISRKDALAVGRQNNIHQISGNNDNSLYKPVKISEYCGVESQESVAVYLDTAYFLWKDGVYQLDNEGLKCISDNAVRSWFATGDYFNQSKFNVAFGFVDPNTKRYKLFLCSAGSSTIDRWVEYDIIEKTWWGPHTTGAFTPSSTLVSPTAQDVQIPMVGSSSGYLWKEQAARTDDTATAIDFDVDTKRHDAGTPNIDKAWKDLTVTGVPLSTGRLIITPSVGELDAAAASQTLRMDLSEGSAFAGRLGFGKHAKLNFRENTVGQDVQLTGYELDFHELGKR